MSSVSLEDQVAVVTGSGAGLGRAYVLDLARRGAAVVVNDVDRERANAVVAEVESEGGRAVASYDSVAEREGGQGVVRTAVDAFGTVHAVVNNAGIMRNGLFEDQTPEDFELVWKVHAGGCFHVTQAAWPVMRANGYGRVVMVGSAGGMWAMQAMANYAAAKGGVYGLARALAFEGRDHGILVNTVLPGAATTIAAGSPIPDYAKHFASQELQEALAPRRAAEAVAPLVTFLASRACELTAETFSAVAGRFARVVVAVTDGWFAEDHLSVTPEDIVAHLDEIRDASEYHVPFSLYDEYAAIGHHLGVTGGVR